MISDVGTPLSVVPLNTREIPSSLRRFCKGGRAIAIIAPLFVPKGFCIGDDMRMLSSVCGAVV